MKKIIKIFLAILVVVVCQSSILADEVDYDMLKKQGMDAYNRKDYVSALQYLTAIPKEKHTLEIVICIANSYESVGDTHSAVMLLESLNKNNLNNYSAFYNLGNIYLKAKVYNNAIESYRLCTRLNTRFAPGFYNLGIAYFETKDYNKALFNFEKAIRLNPSNKDYIYNAAVCLEAMGDTKTAEEYYRRAK